MQQVQVRLLLYMPTRVKDEFMSSRDPNINIFLLGKEQKYKKFGTWSLKIKFIEIRVHKIIL